MGIILDIIAGILLVAVAITAWKHPHLRRMAFRNVWIHKKTTLLTIIGAMVGTALITTSILLQHSMNLSVDRVFIQQFGNIASDLAAVEQMNLKQPFFTIGDVERMKSEASEKGRNILPTVAMDTTFMVQDAAGKPLLVAPRIYLYGFDPAAGQIFDAKAMSLIPKDLQKGEVILSTGVAEKLDVQAGKQVELLDGQKQMQKLVVRAVVPEAGLTGYKGIQVGRGTAIVSLETSRQLAQLEQGYTNVLVSNSQDDPDGRAVVLDYKVWKEHTVKASTRMDLEHNLKFMPVFFLASLTSILIGMMLIINLFKMMAEERQKEMSILRAIGMTRDDLVRLLRMEGMFYAVISSVVGIFVGLGLARFLMMQLSDLFRLMAEYEQGLIVSFSFDAGIPSMLTGFSTGLIFIYVCVWFVSRRIARLKIVEGLNGEQKDGASKGEKGNSVFQTGVQLFLFILPFSLILISLTDSYRTYVNGSELGPLLHFVMGVAILLFVSTWFIFAMGRIVSFITWMFRPFPKLYGILKLALRYPEVNRVRSGLLMLMFALVLFFTSFSGTFSKTFSQYFGDFNARKATAGYDLLAVSQGKLTSGELSEMLHRSSYVDKNNLGDIAAVQQVPMGELAPYYYNGLDGQFAAHTTLTLKERDKSYSNDRLAWSAVTNDPNLIILSDHLLNLDGKVYKVGEMYPFPTSAGVEQKKIIGIANYETEMYGYTTSYGAWVKQSEMARMVTDDKRIQTTLLIQGKGNGKLSEFARGIEKEFTLHNIFPLVNPQETFVVSSSFMRVFFSLFEGFSSLSTIIGITGLMVVILRMVRERRQQIGMLRAIGVKGNWIFWSLFVEGAVLGLTGILFGMAMGVYTGYMIITSLAQDGGSVGGTTSITILFPYVKLGIYFVAAFVLTVAGIVFPARKAVHLSPAEATRYVG